MIPARTFLSLPPDQITPTIEQQFFSSLRLKNGTYKTTYRHRFRSIDLELRELVRAGKINAGQVLDIGISSGVSTLELERELSADDREARIIGTDLMVDAFLVHAFPGCWALVDDTGYPLRYDIFKWSMKPWVVKADYRSGFFVLRKLLNLALGHRVRKKMRRAESSRVEKVALVTPRLNGHANIMIRPDDITVYNKSFEGRFSFIRAANILNKAYFPDDVMVSVVSNVVRYLAGAKSTLLVVRTHEDGVNHGTLFAKDGQRGCSVMQRFGRGSEVEDIVLACMRRSCC